MATNRPYWFYRCENDLRNGPNLSLQPKSLPWIPGRRVPEDNRIARIDYFFPTFALGVASAFRSPSAY